MYLLSNQIRNGISEGPGPVRISDEQEVRIDAHRRRIQPEVQWQVDATFKHVSFMIPKKLGSTRFNY